MTPKSSLEPEWPSLDALHYFEVLAQSPSFSAAAKQLGLTQQALSKSLAQLELALQAPLLQRRPLALTPAGEVLLTQTQAILTSCREIERRFARLPDPEWAGDKSPLKLGLPACLGPAVLRALNAQADSEPESQGWGPIHFVSQANFDTPLDGLPNDLDLLLWPKQVEDKGLSCCHWKRTRFGLVARPETLGTESVGVRPFSELTRLMLPQWPECWKAALGQSPSQIWAEVDFDVGLELLCALEDAAMWLPELAVQAELAAGQLISVPQAPQGPELDLYWLWATSKPNQQRVLRLLSSI
jgi:DNA-binding transcriptional LysR family regulator